MIRQINILTLSSRIFQAFWFFYVYKWIGPLTFKRFPLKFEKKKEKRNNRPPLVLVIYIVLLYFPTALN